MVCNKIDLFYPIRFLDKYCIKMDPKTLLTNTRLFLYIPSRVVFLCCCLRYSLNSISNPCLDSLSPLSHSQFFPLFFSCYTICCLSRSHHPLTAFLFFFLQPDPICCEAQFLKKRIIEASFIHYTHQRHSLS